MTVFTNDPDLLARFRSGQRDALARVYWFYVARIEALLRSGLLLSRGGALSAAGLRSETADLVQDVFMRAFAESSRRAYDGVREYRPFLITIARNALTDHLRKLGREIQTDEPRLERLLEGEPPGVVEEPEWEDPQKLALAERYAAALPLPEHAVYVQRFVEGRSQQDAADALGISRQRIRTLEAHIRAGLAKELARANLSAGPRADGPSAGSMESSQPELAALRIKREGDG